MKAHLRSRLRALLTELPPEELAEKSRRICSVLKGLEEFVRADPIFLYVPIAGEVDTRPLAEAAWQAGKTVLAPQVNWAENRMDAVAIASMTEGLTVGRYGIPEPTDGEAVPPERIGLIVAPGLAYDRSCRRLGRGGGFYDRFLARAGLRAVVCGVAFDEQVVDALTVEEHDVPVDLLVTDREVLRRTGGDPKEL